MKPLSWFLERTPAVSQLDLLKVNVEGAELDFLVGLDDAQWKIIWNVVLEIRRC